MSSYHCICVLILTATRSLLVAAYNVLSVHISPHTTTCVRMPLHMCPHATTYVSSVCVLIPLYPITSCPHTTVYVSSCLLYMCPHTTILCVLLLGTARSWRSVPHCSPAHSPGSRRALYGSLLRYSVYLLYWYYVYLLYCSSAHPVAGLCMALSCGTQFTCFTGTKVQILTTVGNSFCHSVFPFIKTLQASASRRKCRNRL